MRGRIDLLDSQMKNPIIIDKKSNILLFDTLVLLFDASLIWPVSNARK